MQNAIKSILKWQSDAGNLDQPYDDSLESSFQIEEALEGLTYTGLLQDELGVDDDASPEDLSRIIVARTQLDDNGDLVPHALSDVARFDKACDAIVYAIGSLGKLGLSAQQINQGLLAVNHANRQKLNAKRDSAGKLGKPDNFVGPEPELQRILDKRE